MPTRLDRYLIRELLLTFAATVLVLLTMALVNKLAGYMDRAASGALAQEAIGTLLGLQAVRYLVVLVPLSWLLTIMLVLGRLYRDNEMTALLACGIGPVMLYRPLLGLGVPLALVLAVIALDLAPRSAEQQLAVQVQARQTAQVSVFTPGTFREVMGGKYVIYVGDLATDNLTLQQVFIRSQEAEGIAVTLSDYGHQETDPATGLRHIVLEQGHRYQGVPGRADFQQLAFQRLTVQVDASTDEPLPPKSDTIPTAELWASSALPDRAELQVRLSGPLALLLLTLLAPLLAHTQPREGRYSRVVVAILVYTLYVNLLKAGQSWLAGGLVWPVLGLWWVHGLVGSLGLGLWLYRYGFRPSRRRR